MSLGMQGLQFEDQHMQENDQDHNDQMQGSIIGSDRWAHDMYQPTHQQAYEYGSEAHQYRQADDYSTSNDYSGYYAQHAGDHSGFCV